MYKLFPYKWSSRLLYKLNGNTFRYSEDIYHDNFYCVLQKCKVFCNVNDFELQENLQIIYGGYKIELFTTGNISTYN